jgi:SEC-C motif-containing protein
MTEPASCPCGSGAAYGACCGRYIDAGLRPDTAEQLMRSRYAAYVLVREDYLRRTWHVSTRPDTLNLEPTRSGKWLGLEILRTEGGGAKDTEGMVEFVARYKPSGKAERLHESSRFVRDDGQWFYVDGEILPS